MAIPNILWCNLLLLDKRLLTLTKPLHSAPVLHFLFAAISLFFEPLPDLPLHHLPRREYAPGTAPRMLARGPSARWWRWVKREPQLVGWGEGYSRLKVKRYPNPYRRTTLAV
jgi:hypothetical protein